MHLSNLSIELLFFNLAITDHQRNSQTVFFFTIGDDTKRPKYQRKLIKGFHKVSPPFRKTRSPAFLIETVAYEEFLDYRPTKIMELGFWMVSVQLSLKLTRDKLPVNFCRKPNSNSFTLRIHKSRRS